MQTVKSYEIGNRVTLSAVFKSEVTGTFTDPTTVVVRVRDPIGVETTPTPIIHEGTGLYNITIDPEVPGIWVYRWEGAGAVVAVDERRFEIRGTVF